MISQFNFFQQWYPLSPVEDLDPQRPTKIMLLGLNLVIWKPKSSPTYQVFLDQCPHRLAPLSEGRIDEKSGYLMCSYHGWEFDKTGICQRIPQAENPDLVTKNQANFACTVFPCREQNDLLWVWPDANSQELAEKTPLSLSPNIDKSKGFVWSSYVRDMAYDSQTLVENVADPSHVPFAHHGIQGNRNLGKPIPLKIVESSSTIIKVEIDGDRSTIITFEPPCRLEYSISNIEQDKQIGLVVYCLPVSPGKSRIVAQFPRNFAKIIHSLTPRWWTHLMIRNPVLEGDMILLNQQEYVLQQRQAHESWKTAYKMPTDADRMVIEFRRWFDMYCQGKLPWDKVGINNTSLTLNNNRREVLDRYQQHTQHCISCRNTLKQIQRLQFFLLTYFVLTVLIVVVMPDELRKNLGLFLVGFAILGLGVYSWLKWWLEPQFYFIDYVHADKK
ncbi:aromatic ring-hydroxylating dioxygenase subunit alpha [Aphanothece sacrum]|uniref:Accelerated cell death 1 n=1 Tax=Aphanothece sacrum FPU1 TaxID=1920663 RepID=A0A401IKV1_APHSA|nr:Rieske 2Fe-2S domain-containing protein [Aphanothece sacrum]GBF81865.1 accelerated cell death 1 [Aphanothece sacrum FPU1]GBF85684.1 hypothetical protein AsFPU3_2749 [Aphanothece sacrum FPU3]